MFDSFSKIAAFDELGDDIDRAVLGTAHIMHRDNVGMIQPGDGAGFIQIGYGILGPLGFYRRSIFVIDADGIVRYAHRSVTSLSFQPVDVIAEQLRKLDAER